MLRAIGYCVLACTGLFILFSTIKMDVGVNTDVNMSSNEKWSQTRFQTSADTSICHKFGPEIDCNTRMYYEEYHLMVNIDFKELNYFQSSTKITKQGVKHLDITSTSIREKIIHLFFGYMQYHFVNNINSGAAQFIFDENSYVLPTNFVSYAWLASSAEEVKNNTCNMLRGKISTSENMDGTILTISQVQVSCDDTTYRAFTLFQYW